MFLASDRLEHRETRIREFLRRDPAIAVLLAAASFEWSVSRAIVRFGRTPNAPLRDRLVRCYGGPKAYKDLWRDEVVSAEHPKQLVEVVQNWEALLESFSMRNGLIHGRATCTRNTASPKVEALVRASRDIAAYFEARGTRINNRIAVRRKFRAAP